MKLTRIWAIGLAVFLVSVNLGGAQERLAPPKLPEGDVGKADRPVRPIPSVDALAKQLPCTVEFFDVDGHRAFLIRPERETLSSPVPWVWYAPVIGHPNTSHAWMLKQWLEKGIGMAGVDVGESFGSPQGRKVYAALWETLTTRYKMSERPCLLPQSRGGLMLYNWAAENPARVAGIAGIYTVCDLRSYPGLERACGAYGLSAAELEARLTEHNPIDRLSPLAKAGVPILHVHGDADEVVPLEKNSGELARRYRALGGQMQLIVIPGKGHQVCDEFFQCRELLDFVVANCNSTKAQSAISVPLARDSAIVDLVRAAAVPEVKDCYPHVLKAGFPAESFAPADIGAFEEHRLFVVAAGEASKFDPAKTNASRETPPRWTRRFLLLKPATVLIEDHIGAGSRDAPVSWVFLTENRPEVAGTIAKMVVGDHELIIQPLPLNHDLPQKLSLAARPRDGQHAVEVQAPGGAAERHVAFVVHVRSRGQETARNAKVSRDQGVSLLGITADQFAWRLLLPPYGVGAGEIEVTGPDGREVLARRLLPAGVLPRGPAGPRLLERWDSAYRGGRGAPWDTGRPSSDLKQAVKDGTLRPCRVVELGCGTGTNAIYLANKGFDVTAVDIAPTALSLARQKAAKAGQKVQWLLADVLAPPKLKPFDLIYDRGCYHGVRQQQAAAYVAAVNRLSQPGTRLLILAGNAKESGGGPPRVTEEQLRDDFAAEWDLVWLRETRFDTADADRKGALAWSALLRRKPPTEPKSPPVD